MAKKFDTNPLDPDFPEKVRETDDELQTVTLPRMEKRQTRKFAEPKLNEDETRQFNKTEFGAYQNGMSAHERQPAAFEPRPVYPADAGVKKTHNIGSISLPENILTALPYIPFAFVGIIAGIIELVFIPKSEPKVRYHAAQGIAANLGVYIVLAILGFFSWTDLGSTASTIFEIVTTVMLVIFAFKAWQGKPIHIEAVQDLTDWIEEKIKPQK